MRFAFCNVQKALLTGEGADISFQLRMSQGFVDVIEFHPFRAVVTKDGLHRRDIPKKGRISQIPGDQDRILTFEVAE